jgi:hypothetical protein
MGNWVKVREAVRLGSSLFFQASHSASILASIMHLRPTKMLMWHLIKEERDD